MPRNNGPEIRPVKLYREPRYPSWEDPDPTVHPYPVSYPFGEKLVKAVASMGLASALYPASVQAEGAKDGPKNPLTVAQSGLPYRAPSYGTGLPQYVDDDLARRTLSRLFREAGYQLQSGYQYDRDGISFVADGYDAKKNVGYVFANWGNLDHDGILRWWARGKEMDTRGLLEAILKYARTEEDKVLKKEFEESCAIEDPEKREAALQAVLARYSAPRLSLAEARVLEEGNAEEQGFVAIVSKWDRRFASPSSWSPEMRKEMKRALAIPDPAKRKTAIRTLQEKQARQALENLERCVGEYIAWARSQGAP